MSSVTLTDEFPSFMYIMFMCTEILLFSLFIDNKIAYNPDSQCHMYGIYPSTFRPLEKARITLLLFNSLFYVPRRRMIILAEALN